MSAARAVLAAFAAALSLGACATAPLPASSPSASNAYANFLVGRLADLREDHRAASDRFFHALRDAPADPVLLRGALVSSLAVGDADRARSAARIAIENDAEIGYARVVRAADNIAARRWRQARSELALVRGESAEELTRRLLDAWAAAGAGRGAEAAAELAQINAPRPYNALLAYQRALLLEASDPVAARAAYDQAVTAGMWLPPAMARNADLISQAGDRAAAVELLRSREGRFGSPAVLAAADRIAAGGKADPTPLTPARGAAIGLYGLALIFLEESDVTHGLATLTLALMLDPNMEAARIAFAEAQIDLNHPDEARAVLQRLAPDSPYAQNARALETFIALQQGEQEAAIRLASANIEAGGGARAQRTLADLYRTLERFSEAEPLYTALIDSAPAAEPDWRLHFSRGMVRERLGRWTEAQADLERALELSPDQPEVLNYLGYTWVDRGENLEEALALIERAAQLRPLSGAIIDSLGWAHYRMGNYPLALEFLERAVALEPADPILNDHLGDAYWRNGRRIEARFQWQRALSLNPSEADRDTIVAKLEQGLAPASGTRSATR